MKPVPQHEVDRTLDISRRLGLIPPKQKIKPSALESIKTWAKSKLTPKPDFTNEHVPKIFDTNAPHTMVHGDDLQHRPSPDDAVERSRSKAKEAIKGGYAPRAPISVWAVNRNDGSKFYSVRDGNTTVQMLKKQGITNFPVKVEKTVHESELTPVEEHKQEHPYPKALKRANDLSNKAWDSGKSADHTAAQKANEHAVKVAPDGSAELHHEQRAHQHMVMAKGGDITKGSGWDESKHPRDEQGRFA